MKKTIALLLALCMLFALAACAAPASPSAPPASNSSAPDAPDADKEYKIGMTVMDLSNPIWAEICDYVVSVGKEKYNASVTILECKNDPATQISQVENFINMGVDAIIVAAIDANAMDKVCQDAMDAGILVMGYAQKLNVCDLFLINDNAGAGTLIGEMVADFVNENHGGEAEVGLITYYEAQETLDRSDAMQAALKEKAPGAKVVMEASAVVADLGMEITENFLQAYPNMKAIMSIGDGAAIGANQAVKAANKQDGFGIFAIDCTIEAMQIMANGESIIGEVSFGTGRDLGTLVIETCMNALISGNFEQANYTPNIVVTPDNLAEKVTEWGYEDQVDVSKLTN